MKKFTLFLMLLIAGSISMSAQNMHILKKPVSQKGTRHTLFSAPATLVAPQKAPLRAKKHPIDEQPEGEVKTYAMSTYYYSQNMDEWVHRYGQKTMVVFGSDNEVYIQNIINTNLYGSWIVGEISADRKHVVFENYQPYVEQGDYTYYVSLAYVNNNGDVFPDTEADEFQFDYDEATGRLSNPGLNLSLVNEDGGVFTFNEGYDLTLFTDELVQLPESVQKEDIQPYSLKYETTNVWSFPSIVYVAQVGDDFYFKGFSSKTPDSWLKGSFNEAKDSVIIPNGQYLGLYDGLYFLYCKGASYSGMDADGWPIYSSKDYAALKFNASDRSFYGPDGILVVLGKELKGGYSQSIPSQDMKPFYGVAAKPKTPTVRTFDIDTQFYQVQSSISYVVPVEDVNGNFISPDSLYYRFFIDGEQLHFDNVPGGYYQHFPDEWEVPCAFSDRGLVNNRTDNGSGSMTYHVMAIDKDLRPETIGLQSIYYMNGSRTLSDTYVYYTATKTYSIVEGDPDPSITGIDSVSTGNVVGVSYYDLSGRQIDNLGHGLYLKSMHYADGTVKTIKVLK
jgi:hypothetical protein